MKVSIRASSDVNRHLYRLPQGQAQAMVDGGKAVRISDTVVQLVPERHVSSSQSLRPGEPRPMNGGRLGVMSRFAQGDCVARVAIESWRGKQ